MKTCIDCPVTFDGSRRKRCLECHKVWRHRLYRRNNEPRRGVKRHGMTPEWFDEQYALGCAVCKQPFTETPHVDHDHTHCAGRFGCSECVRGLLCPGCNNGLVYAVELNPALRQLVASSVLDYIDKLRTAPDLLLMP